MTAVEWLVKMYFSQKRIFYGDEIKVAKEIEEKRCIDFYIWMCKVENLERINPEYVKELYNVFKTK